MKKEKINIDERYFEHEEFSSNHKSNQNNYFRALKETFYNEWSSLNSFIDVGCRQGYLMDYFYQDNPNRIIQGMDYFTWGKKLWDKNHWIQENYQQHDLRDTLRNTEWLKVINKNKLFDLVNCTEVGEHIDPDYCDVFLDNLASITNKYLIISWSPDNIENGASDPRHQHVNALDKEDFYNKMNEFNFNIKNKLTDELVKNCKKYYAPSWYVSNAISVWELNK
jgi:hypothetical protein